MTVSAREVWLAERRKGIGGSDAHHIFSEPPYGCARMLAYDKLDIEPDYPRETTGAMIRGTKLEDLVVDIYMEETGRTVTARPRPFVSPDYRWARVNIDREIDEVEEHEGPGVLEVKTAGEYEFRRVLREGMQPGYILQIMHAHLVTGFRWGSFALLHPDTWRFIYFDLDRDDALIEQIARAGGALWRQIEQGKMPDPLPAIDGRCTRCPWRLQCRGGELELAAGIPSEADADIEEDDSFDELLADYAEAKRMADEAGETVELLKSHIVAKIGERDAVRCERGKVYLREQGASRIDVKMLRARYPKIAAECTRKGVTRPLRIFTR